MIKKENGIFTALFVTLLWGSIFPIIKKCYSVYNITSVGDMFLFAGIRFVLSGGITFIFTLIKKEWRKGLKEISAKSIGLILTAGLFAVILQNVFTYPALRITDSSVAAILKQSAALLYVAFSFLFIKEDKPNVNKIAGAILGFLGILTINYTESRFVYNIGNLLMIFASFCIVISSIIYKKTFKYINPIPATAVSQLFGGIVLTAIGFFLDGKITVNSVCSLWLLVYIGIVSSVSYALWYAVVNKAELSKLFIVKFAEPVFSCLFAAVILHENVFTLQHLLACVLIFSGIYISNRK